MQMLKIDNHLICAPDTEIRGMTLATVMERWIAIGAVGDSHGLLLEQSEWPAFVKFVNEIDADAMTHRR